MIGIYKITEISTGRCYIGQSIRCHSHSANKKLGTQKGRWLEHHKRFPPALFTYEVVREVSNLQFMNSFEKFYIKLYDSHANGFNKTIGGSGMKVLYVSADTREKIRAAAKGRLSPKKGIKFPDSVSQDTKEKMRVSSLARWERYRQKKQEEIGDIS